MTAISDLEIFARVARTGNMSAAGREMNLSPAVVSKRISMLEEKLEARLFQRTTRQLTLTEVGEGYFKRVVDILTLCEEANDFVSRRNSRARGQLKVTAPTTFSRLHIAPHLAEFMRRYPQIEVDFQLTDQIVDIIRDGYDLAIRIGELQDSSLVARKLAPDKRVLCATRAYLDQAPPLKSLADLELHNCLTTSAQDIWRLEGPQGTKHLRVKGSLRTNSSEFVREALLASQGIGLRSTWEIGNELKSGALETVLPEWRGASSIAIYAIYPCREFMPAKVTALIEFLAELYGPEPYWERDPAQGAVTSSLKPPRAASSRSDKGSLKAQRALKTINGTA